MYRTDSPLSCSQPAQGITISTILISTYCYDENNANNEDDQAAGKHHDERLLSLVLGMGTSVFPSLLTHFITCLSESQLLFCINREGRGEIKRFNPLEWNQFGTVCQSIHENMTLILRKQGGESGSAPSVMRWGAGDAEGGLPDGGKAAGGRNFSASLSIIFPADLVS